MFSLCESNDFFGSVTDLNEKSIWPVNFLIPLPISNSSIPVDLYSNHFKTNKFGSIFLALSLTTMPSYIIFDYKIASNNIGNCP